MKKITLDLRIIVLFWLSVLRGGDSYSNCPYGHHCNEFEPAPPGKSPPCAKPGFTYCVDPDPYPSKIIRKLLEAGRYDIHKLLLDESRDEFSATTKPHYPYSYGPNSLHNIDQISLTQPFDYTNKFHNSYGHEVYSHKTPLQPPSPMDPSPYNINAYQSSNFSKFGYNYQSPNYWPQSYEKSPFAQNTGSPNFALYNQNFYNNYDSDIDWEPSRFKLRNDGVTPYNPNEWWKYQGQGTSPDVTIQRSITFPTRTSIAKRSLRKKPNAEPAQASSQTNTSGAEAFRIALGLSAETVQPRRRERRRRQSPEREALCPVRTEYITPRAALNNKGSWRYVVNMPDAMTQLVKVEICRSNVCNGICSLPLGYTSRCEQKYIQKRLMALEQTGDNLYTDVFWFPSCCQCTITPDDSG